MKVTGEEFQPALTPREFQVLNYIAHGASAKEMAEAMLIAQRTVERYVDNLKMKMGARNRAHLISIAVARGILVLNGQSD